MPKSDFEVVYPSWDGELMAETGLHVLVIMDLYYALEVLLGGRSDVCLASNIFWYYQEGNPEARQAPDIMVIFGVPRDPPRASFFSWREAAVPAVIFEITSKATWSLDWLEKRALYAYLGVQEYFLYDPLHEYLDRPLMGFRLSDGEYKPLAPAEDGSLTSEVLGVRVCVDGQLLRLIEAKTGRKLPHLRESADADRAAGDTLTAGGDQVSESQP
jgi:Uma2 family endonuclease